MKQRIITGFIILLLVIPLIVFGDPNIGGIAGQSVFLSVVILLSFYASYEISNFVLGGNKNKNTIYLLTTLNSVIILAFLLGFFIPLLVSNSQNLNENINFNILPIWSLSFIVLILIPLNFIFIKDKTKISTYLFLTLSYTLWAFSIIFLNYQYGIYAIMFPIIVTVCSDSFGYFIGRKFGKKKIAPMTSPNKTLEGLVGGTFIASLVGTLWSFFLVFDNMYDNQSELIFWVFLSIFISFIISIISFFGDLSFSKFKRINSKKDYGSILPGHGGLLDRIDSHIFSAPLTFIILLSVFTWGGI